jgi:hypothetical protein
VSDLGLAAALFAPLFVGLTLHGLSIKHGWLNGLRRPIDRGRTWRGRRLFGENKTYRGVVAVALGTAVGFQVEFLFPRWTPEPLSVLPGWGIVLFGLGFGAAAMLSELPNSLLKRQLGIGPGKTARGPAGALFFVLDQVDVLVGAWLVAALFVPPTPRRVFYSFAFVFVVHQLISVAGHKLGMRATAR